MNDSIRILITEKCNANCKNCFNALYRTNKEMKIEKLEKLASYLSSIGIKNILIEGGEPTIHSEFFKVMEIIKKYFESFTLFTNGISSNIYNLNLRKSDNIVYNFNFIDDNFELEKLLLNKDGKRSFMVQISKNTNVEKLIGRLQRFDEILKKKNISILLTLDCTINIFDEKDILTKKWNDFISCCVINMWNLKIDHGFPFCIKNDNKCMMLEVYDGNIEKKKDTSKMYFCDYKRAGLIDSNLNLRYCNNFSNLVLKIVDENLNFISKEKIVSFLKKAEKEKNDNMRNECKICEYYKQRKCNGTCFSIIRSDEDEIKKRL